MQLIILIVLMLIASPASAEPLKATITHSDQLNEYGLHPGQRFDPSKFSQTQDWWVPVPGWYAGSWRSSEVTHWSPNGAPVRSSLIENSQAGYQQDARGQIWHMLKLPGVSECLYEGLPAIKITQSFEIDRITNDVLESRAKGLFIQLDQFRNVTKVFKTEQFSKNVLMSSGIKRNYTKQRLYDVKGKFISEQDGFCDSQMIAAYTPVDNFYGIDLKASLAKFLAAHPGLAGGSPATPSIEEYPRVQNGQP